MMNDGALHELPRGWVWTKLGDICSNVKIKSVEGSALYLEIGDIDIQNKKYLIGEKPTVKGALMSKKDDILISKVRPTRGAITITQQKEINVSSAITVLRTCQEIIPFYILYFLAWNKSFLNYLGENSAGTMYPTVKDDFILTYDVPLPPLPEQRAIVSKIEQLFSDLDNGIQNFKNAQEQLKLYRQSVLKAACEGKLVPTEAELAQAEGRDYEAADVLLARILKERRKKWEDDQIIKFKKNGKMQNDNKWISKFKPPVFPNIDKLPNLPEGWTWASPEQISSWTDPYSLAIGPFGSNLKVSDYASHGVPLVFVRNIRSGVFLDDKTKYVSDAKANELRPHWIASGDILITKMGDPPGDSHLYPEGLPKAIITADCIKLRLCPLFDSNKYFVNAIKTQIVRSQIISITQGVAQKKVSLARIKTIGLPIPPLAEQRRIVAEVERRLSVCDKMEATITESLQKAEALRQSILKKAFEDKLLNERELEEARNAPDWEPAEKLLERINAEKTNINKGKSI